MEFRTSQEGRSVLKKAEQIFYMKDFSEPMHEEFPGEGVGIMHLQTYWTTEPFIEIIMYN